MLSELYIRNYLLLPETRMSLTKGFTVISGETGAGKSVLIGSLNLIFGENSAGTEAYDKSQPIYLEATFVPENDPGLSELMRQNGWEKEEELILAREISISGKSAYFLNGRKVAVSLLKELKNLLIDFHHQRDQQKLLQSSYQLELLDDFAGLGEIRSDYAGLYRELKSSLNRLDELVRTAEQQKQLQELYRFQLEELENAKLIPGEDEALQSEFELLSHGAQINELSGTIQNGIYEGENSIYDQVSAYLGELQRFEKLNPRLEQAAVSLNQALEAMQDASHQLSGINEELSANPQRLEEIQKRLDTINVWFINTECTASAN